MAGPDGHQVKSLLGRTIRVRIMKWERGKTSWEKLRACPGLHCEMGPSFLPGQERPVGAERGVGVGQDVVPAPAAVRQGEARPGRKGSQPPLGDCAVSFARL